MDYEVGGVRPRGGPKITRGMAKNTWSEVIREDCWIGELRMQGRCCVT